ncbi:MAG: tetratricopeptide repeat protein [Candidatus Azobacteroides sp.]|nr:tetratricopeptide repeat protein [Candidatus Azobacteroides sp.]
MKKFVFTGVLCFLVSLSFGQKKAVSAAKDEIKNNPPNITEARSLIKDALTNPETAEDAEAWYVAGLIENKQFDTEKTLEILGKAPNEEVMYDALDKIIPYFLKSAELDQLPDAKGKVKPKYLKDIRSIIKANHVYYINAGVYAFNKENFKSAYENFKQYGDIPSLDIFKDEKWDTATGDTTDLQIRYYAGLAAARIPDHQAAIAMYSGLKDRGYVENGLFKESDIYKELAREYDLTKDSVNFVKIIKEGFVKFPGEDYYLLNMINLSINSGKTEEAVDYLEKAIAQNPNNAQLYAVRGQLFSEDKKPDEAIKNLKKALEMDPDNAAFMQELGRIYFNLGVEKRKAADEASDVAQSKDLAKESLDFYRQSMPYFEKVFEKDANNKDAIFALRTIYFNLNMEPQFNKMDALVTGGNN